MTDLNEKILIEFYNQWSPYFNQQALAFVPPIRDFFLREENYQSIKRPPGDIMFPLGKTWEQCKKYQEHHSLSKLNRLTPKIWLLILPSSCNTFLVNKLQ